MNNNTACQQNSPIGEDLLKLANNLPIREVLPLKLCYHPKW